MTDLFKQEADAWDERQTPGMISKGVGSAMLDKLDLTADMRVMDFGAGTGLICSQIAPKVQTIYAVDISAAMLEKLAEKPELKDKVSPVCQDILVTPLDVSVDLVVSAMAMHHVEDTSHLLQTLANHLGPRGQVALADLDKEDGTFHPANTEGVYHQGFDREQLRATLLASGFENIEFSTAVSVPAADGGDRRYPIFLVTANKVVAPQ